MGTPRTDRRIIAAESDAGRRAARTHLAIYCVRERVRSQYRHFIVPLYRLVPHFR
jgi:hypothetical protein